jgi:hypothetical protein
MMRGSVGCPRFFGDMSVETLEMARVLGGRLLDEGVSRNDKNNESNGRKNGDGQGICSYLG